MKDPEADYLSRLETLVPSLAGAVEREQLGDALSSAIATLNNSGDRFRRFDTVADFIPVLRNKADAQAINGALEAIEEFGDTLKAAKTLEDFRSMPVNIRLALKSIQDLDTIVRRLWETYVLKAIGPTDRLGKVLSQIEGMTAIGDDLIAISDEAQVLAEAVSDEKEQSKVLKKLIKRAEAAKSKATTGDRAVDDFLAALAEERATLADVTPRVLAWAKKAGALEQLSVRI